MKTPLEMAALRFRIAVQQALAAGVGSAQLQILLLEECVNEVDFAGVYYALNFSQKGEPAR